MIGSALTYEAARRRWRRRAVRGFAAKRRETDRSAWKAVFAGLFRLFLAAGLLAEALTLAAGAVRVERAGSVRELDGPAVHRGDVRRGIRLLFEDGAVSLFSEEEYGEERSVKRSD